MANVAPILIDRVKSIADSIGPKIAPAVNVAPVIIGIDAPDKIMILMIEMLINSMGNWL